MDIPGRSLTGFVYVDPEGFSSEIDLEAWVTRALKFALSLPAKPGGGRPGRGTGKSDG